MISFSPSAEDDPLSYATLSHTWGDEEVTFQDFQVETLDSDALMEGYHRILACCNQARKDGISFVWIDTCCIDKANSVELSEAVNSMYSCTLTRLCVTPIG
jgi:hypothetical protein